ncbi:hypothetical protein K502DRAFT_324974 [Neoconidiobolus thromboides FSU 785]|nr:hypothetical protein K502DRAFT_324974 [Neoconidiobolus thromboides FSU 785]
MIHKSFVKLANLKCTKLIIDVSYNTGGPICTSLSLLDYINNQESDNEDSSNELNHNAINKSNSNHHVQYTTRMKNTLLANLLAESASVQNKQNHRVWGSNNWIDINNKQYNNNSWLTPGYLTERSKNINVNLMEYVNNNKDKSLNVNQLIANSNSNYQVLSNYFMDKCPKSELNNQKFPFQLENLMILTNGICLSSCSTLLNGFIQFNNPKIKIIYTDGHNMNTNQVSPHNMEGGQLYIYDKLIEDIENLRLKFNTNYKSIIPEIFPLATQFTFTLREQYLVKSNNPKSLTIYNSTMPMEYLNYVPTDRVYTNEILPQLPYNLGYHWIKASKLF